MDEKKVREAIYCMKSFADDTVCEECDNYDRCDHTMVANNARTAIEHWKSSYQKKSKLLILSVVKNLEMLNFVVRIATVIIYVA